MSEFGYRLWLVTSIFVVRSQNNQQHHFRWSECSQLQWVRWHQITDAPKIKFKRKSCVEQKASAEVDELWPQQIVGKFKSKNHSKLLHSRVTAEVKGVIRKGHADQNTVISASFLFRVRNFFLFPSITLNPSQRKSQHEPEGWDVFYKNSKSSARIKDVWGSSYTWLVPWAQFKWKKKIHIRLFLDFLSHWTNWTARKHPTVPRTACLEEPLSETKYLLKKKTTNSTGLRGIITFRWASYLKNKL